MKRLWKIIPPCISDVLGFEAVMNETDGIGIIDDPSRYKPLGQSGRHGYGGHGEHRYEERRRGESERGEGERGENMREGNGHGSGYEVPVRRREHGGMERHGGGHFMPDGVRVINSDIRNADIITGTEKKVLQAFSSGVDRFSPDFVLLSYAPSSSMIGSDLDAAAEKITEQSGLPSAAVRTDGERDYLYGIGSTLEVMGKLLLTEQETIPRTINILGGQYGRLDEGDCRGGR